MGRLAVTTAVGRIESETADGEDLLRILHLISTEHHSITDSLQLNRLSFGIDGETAIFAGINIDEELAVGALGVEELCHGGKLNAMPLPIAEDTDTVVEEGRVILEEIVFFLVLNGGDGNDVGGTVGDFGWRGADAGHCIELTESLGESDPVLETIELLSARSDREEFLSRYLTLLCS